MRTHFVGAESSATITQLTVEQFLDFSPKLRAVLICEGLVKFWDEEGDGVPIDVAVNELEDTWFSHGPSSALTALRRKNHERRRHERHWRAFPLRLSGLDSSFDFGVAANMSGGGMLLRTAAPLALGERFHVELPHAAFEAPVVALRSIRVPDHELSYATGVVFDVPPSHVQRAA